MIGDDCAAAARVLHADHHGVDVTIDGECASGFDTLTRLTGGFMTQKLVCTATSLESLNSAVDLLRKKGLNDDTISVVGADKSGTDHLPDAGDFHNDAIPAAARGAAVGSATAVIAGLAATVAMPGLIVGGAAALLLTAAGGASFGALASTLVGASVPNSQIREYEEAIERGEFILIVELEDEQYEGVKQELHKHIPGLIIEGKVDPIPPVV